MKKLIFIFIFTFMSLPAFADIITLKSGKIMIGTIIEQDTNHILVDIGEGVRVTYDSDRIESIVRKPVASPIIIRPQVEQGAIDDLQQAGQEAIEIPLNPLRTLNGLSRDDIFNSRRENVNKIPALAPKNYEPSMNIFGQIQDGKPWWGLLGLSYFGPGKQSIEGHSRESQFIDNPYLLAGICEKYAQIVTDKSLFPNEIYSKPLKLIWGRDGSFGQIIYNVSQSYQLAVLYRYADPQEQYLALINARDFGFNFFTIDASRSRNISGAVNKILPIIQYIHTGGSCGYPGGCNNRSPTQPELIFKWNRLPARIYLKLWKGQPQDFSQKADMDFVIDLK